MSYIGNEPIVSATRTVTEVTATAGQTVFNANGGYTVGYLDVFLNGSKLTTTDFTATDGSSITLTEAAQVGDIVRLEAWGTFSTSTAVLRAGDTMTGALLLPDGSASAPALSNDGDSNTGIFFPAADTIAFSEGGTEAMRIDSSGNVGIGTSSPSGIGKLINIVGSSTTAPSTYTAGNSDNSQFVTMYSGSVSAGDVSAIYFNNGLRFATASTPTAVGFTERMRIDSSGALLVGTTTGANTNGVVIQRGGAVNGGIVQLFKTGSGLTNGLLNYYGATYVGGINFDNTSTSFPTSSDIRLKKNIVDAPSAISKVQNIRIVSHGWKNDDAVVEFGVIAQELASIAPSAVMQGDDEEEVVTTWSVDYSKLVPILTKAIQEQQALIQSQADTITAMEAQLTNINLTVADATARLTALEGKQ